MPQGITFSGLGSGLDTDTIIKQLTEIERRPIQLIQRKQARLQEQREIFRSINTGLLSLKGSVEKLADEKLFSIVKASSSDGDRVAVKATGEAAAGTFDVEVLALAQARSLSSRSFSSLSGALNLSGEFVINGKSIEIEAEDSLVDVRQAIAAADAGVSAQILTVSPQDNRLILTAEQVGEDSFDLRDASATDLLQSLGFTSGATLLKNSFASGARSARFLSATQAVGTLLGLADPPAGAVSVAGVEVEVDLGADSLEDIRDKINAAAPAGVSASVVSTAQGGLTRFHLQIDGSAEFADPSGALEALGVLDAEGELADAIAGGAESDAFNSTTTAVGSLLGLGGAPAGAVTIGGTQVSLDLAADSLSDLRDKINAAAPAGVSASIVSSTDVDGNSRFRLRIAGTTSFTDAGNALEALGILEGSNSTFGKVAQALTANAANQKQGDLLHLQGSTVTSGEFASSSDTIGALNGSAAAGAVTIGDQSIALDLAADSLEDIRDKINAAAPAGVVASVKATGPASFALEISGTTSFADAGGVLEALDILGPASTITADTRFADISGAGVKAGDTISISGTDHNGAQISGSFSISSASLKMQNLLSAIEQAFGGGVTASIDASGRIAVQDKTAGKSALSLSLQANNEGGGDLDLGSLAVTTQGLEARSSELQAGQDARFRINGIALSRAANTVTDAVEGVTLTLKQAEEGRLVGITITKDDTAELQQNITQFVADFNSSMELINKQFVLDKKTQKGGPLSGDATLLGLQSRLRTLVSGQVEGLTGEFDALVMIGISFDRNGKLNVDEAKLSEALSEDLEAVRRLFVAEGKAADSRVEFISSNKKTKPGDYAVAISQAPHKASAAGTAELSGGLEQDQTLTIVDKASKRAATIELAAGDSLAQVVAKINEALASEVAEVRRGSVANTADGSAPITSSTPFSQIFGAGVQAGDTIRISGTTHGGSSVSSTFAIADPEAQTVGDLLSSIRTAFGGAVSASIDGQGRILVTDNQVGTSSLAVTLVEENEGGGSLNFGSIDVVEEGRPAIEITAANRDGRLVLEHNAFGSRNGFSLSQSLDQLGLVEGEYAGADVEGTINGEEADGFGRILTGAIGAENVEGLSLRVSLTPEELAASGGERGQVKLVHGVARLLSNELSFITDSFGGSLKNRERAIDDTIQDLDQQTAALERRVEVSRLNLVNKFAALEGSLASLQSQGNFLTSQLSGLAAR